MEARSCQRAWGGRASVLALEGGGTIVPIGTGWLCQAAAQKTWFWWLEALEGFWLGIVFWEFWVILWGSLRSKRGVFCVDIKCGLRVCGPKKVFGQGYFEKEKWDRSS